MKKKVCFVTSTRFQKIDRDRFGLKYISKEYEVIIIDLSKLINKRSNIIFNKLKIKNLYEIDNLKKLTKLLKKNTFQFFVDNLNNSFYALVVRSIFKYYNIKSIKYIGGLKPPILYRYIYRRDGIRWIPLSSHEKKFFFKIKEIPLKIKSFIKTSLLKFLNSFFIDIVIVTGKNPQNLEGYLHKKIERIFSHEFYYNYFLKMKKKNIIEKNYILYIDQNFIYHADFFIKKRSPFVSKSFYSKLEKFLIDISKKNNCDFKIALHPKSILDKNNFKFSNKCYLNKTPELIQKSKYVICHYSTAVAFAVLFEKPIISLTSLELDNLWAGAQTRSMSKILNTPLYILEEKQQNLKLENKFDKIKYNNYLNQYIKHPKSNNINSWSTLIKRIKKKN